MVLLVFSLLPIPAAGADLVFGAYLGQNRVQDGPFDLAVPSSQTDLRFEPAEWDGRAFDRPLYWGVRGGWVIGRLGRLELVPEFEFIHAKIYLDTETRTRAIGTRDGTAISEELRVGDVIERFNVSHGVNFLLFNVTVRRGFWPTGGRPGGRMLLVGRVGGGVNIAHFESTMDPFGHHEEYEFGGGAFHAALGVEAPLTNRFGFLAEYKYTAASPQGAVAGGEAKAEVDMHHLVFGFTARF